MRSKYLAVFLSLTFFMVACNKNNDLNYTGDLVHTVNNCISGVVYTYTYNNDGNVASIQESTGGKTLFTYIGATVTMQSFNSANVLTSGYTYLLNSKQLADSAKGMAQAQNVSYSYSYSPTYMLFERRTYGLGSLTAIDKYNIVSKNVSYIEHINPNNNTHTFDRYDYFASNSNTTGNQSLGQNFFGVQTANLVRSNSKVNNNGDTTDILFYRYRFDGSSRPDTVATYNRNNQRVDSVIYTYY